MAEQNFFNEAGITVTNARFIAGGQTHAMSGITAVKSFKHTPSKKGPIILIILGLLFLLAPDEAKIIGLLLLAGGITWLVLKKPTFSVMMSSASGEVEAYTSKDEKFISNVVNAVNEAIIARG